MATTSASASSLTHLKSWKALQDHRQSLHNAHMRDLFAQDPKRFDAFSLKFDDILFDYSKNIITKETIQLLIDLVNEVDLKGWIEKMFNGEKINTTEGKICNPNNLLSPKV